MPSMPVISTETLYVEGIRAFRAGSPDAADPTGLPVSVAFPARGVEPDTGDWQVGVWFDATTASVLVGPGGGVSLPAGKYDVWLKVEGSQETPERKVGMLVIT